jgi:hypothetical protein
MKTLQKDYQSPGQDLTWDHPNMKQECKPLNYNILLDIVMLRDNFNVLYLI